MTKLRSYLEVENVIFTSIGGTRLIGAMAVMNNKGILLSSISSDEEIEVLRRSTGLNVERLSSRFTAVGNLVSANDKGAFHLYSKVKLINKSRMYLTYPLLPVPWQDTTRSVQ